MHLSKLTNFLGRLDKAQIKRLGEFVHSPYFKTPVSAVALFDYLSAMHPGFPAELIQPHVIARKSKLLPTANKQSKAGTDLFESTERFMALEKWWTDENNMLLQLIPVMRDMHMMDRYELALKKLKNNVLNNKEPGLDTFYSRHLLSEFQLNGFDAKLKRNTNNEITPIINTLEEFYAIKKLRYLCEAINRQEVLGIGSIHQQITPLIKILEPFNNEKNPYVQLFIHVARMLIAATYKESLPHYTYIRNLAQANKAISLPESVSESMSYAINSSIKWGRLGYAAAEKEYIWWINFKMEHNLLLESGKLLPITLRNIVLSAANIKASPDWLKKLLDHYIQYIPKDHRETTESFAWGIYYYLIKDYNRAAECLIRAQAREEPIFNCIIRRWHMICLYESGDSDTGTLVNNLEAFEKYLSRHEKHLHRFKPVFESFTRYFRKCLLHSGSRLESIIRSLEKESFFAGQNWLLEQFKS
jgi:hypothetical protein